MFVREEGTFARGERERSRGRRGMFVRDDGTFARVEGDVRENATFLRVCACYLCYHE